METKYELKLVDIQQIANNCGVEISKSQAKKLLNDMFCNLCNENEKLLGNRAKEMFNA